MNNRNGNVNTNNENHSGAAGEVANANAINAANPNIIANERSTFSSGFNENGHQV